MVRSHLTLGQNLNDSRETHFLAIRDVLTLVSFDPISEGEVEEEDGLEEVVERQPSAWDAHVRIGVSERRQAQEVATHHDTSHSATDSTATMHPSTLQYISHRSSSASFAGRCDKVLYDAYPG